MARPTRPAPDLRARTRLDRECGVCKMAKPAADGVALARSDGGYAERVGESGGRGEALDASTHGRERGCEPSWRRAASRRGGYTERVGKAGGRGGALARSDGGYAERVGESGGRGEALDAARARLRALVAEGGVAGGRRAPPI